MLFLKPAVHPNQKRMADTFTTVTTLINSPPGQLVAGGVLAGIVWKFFERVEAVLTVDTKLEIAVWLLGVKVGQKVEPWPETFAKIFDRVLGKKHLSLKCFLRSCLASIAALAICWTIHLSLWPRSGVVWLYRSPDLADLPFTIETGAILALFFNALPDYVSLLETRLILALLRGKVRWFLPALTLDAFVTAGIGWIATIYCVNILLAPVPADADAGSALDFILSGANVAKSLSIHSLRGIRPGTLLGTGWICFYPAFFTSIWLWLYAGSGFLLKGARRFDRSLGWFSHRFDIEKHPLSSIGLVAGALVALIYWAAVIVSRVV